MRGTRRAEYLSWMTPEAPAFRRGLCATFFLLALERVAPLLIALTPVHSVAAIQPSSSRPSVAPPTAAQEIKVRLGTVSALFTVTGVGMSFPGSPAREAGFYQALRVGWIPAGSETFEWTIADRDSGVVVRKFKSRSLEIVGAQIRIDLKPVAGHLILAPKRKFGRRATDIIASLDLEEYVRGVLPAEMPKDWPLEALKAQAIASRTYALFRKRAREAARALYHVESTVMDQVYQAPLLEDRADHETIYRAVRETEGMILVTLAERPAALAAYFHADCGGRTEDAKVVWGEEGVGTTACPFSSRPSWRADLKLTEIESRVRAWSGRLLSASLVGVESIGRTVSGRVDKIRLAWSDGAESLMPAHEFRMSIGHDLVRSTNFRMESPTSGGGIRIVGQGAGHGVGLCQWGARHLALGGKDFREILKFYYPHSRFAAARGI